MLLMVIDRRGFLAASVFTLFQNSALFAKPRSEKNLFAATARDEHGHHFAFLFDQDRILQKVELPSRGHDIAFRKTVNHTSEFVVFARRPGTYAVVFDEKTSLPLNVLSAKQGRHFYGHGTFSHDGNFLYSTENDFENARGTIGVRDARNGYKQIGEFSSYGIGPHDMALLPDGNTLVIANGGIETHPETGRKKLNLSEMKPNLSYVNSHTGKLIDQFALEKIYHQLSIRHLSVGKDGRVIFGCQYQGDPSDFPPLIGHHKMGCNIKLIETDEYNVRPLKNYIGDVAIDATGSLIAATSPKGNSISFWDLKSEKFIGQKHLVDICGIANLREPSPFIMTSGQGQVYQTFRSKKLQLQPVEVKAPKTGLQWDNHLISVS